MTDPNVKAVRHKLLQRSEVGLRKYGVTTADADIDLVGWLRHLQEEILDAAVYIEAAIATKAALIARLRSEEMYDVVRQAWDYGDAGEDLIEQALNAIADALEKDNHVVR